MGFDWEWPRYLPGPMSIVCITSLLCAMRGFTRNGNRMSESILSSAFFSVRMLLGEPPCNDWWPIVLCEFESYVVGEGL